MRSGGADLRPVQLYPQGKRGTIAGMANRADLLRALDAPRAPFH